MNFRPRVIIILLKYHGMDNVNDKLSIGRKTKSINIARKIITKLVKWQGLVVKCVKIRKI